MKRKIKRYKVGLNSQTMAISLVEHPAIESEFIHMSKDDEMMQQVFLEKDEKHVICGPVLIPDIDIYRNNGEMEYYLSFSTESIEKMSHEYLKEFRQKNVSLQHDAKADDIYMIESWIVEDPYRDKSSTMGFNVPKGTWMVSMKVENDDTWKKIKNKEMNGFSVESFISLEDFNEHKDMENFNDENFLTKLKNMLFEVLGKKEEEVKMEEQPIEQPTVVEDNPIEEPKVEEPKVEEPKVEDKPNEEINHLTELINNLKEEIAALKQSNDGLQDKIKEIGKKPSVKPANVNAKPNPSDTYTAWRKQMAEYIR